MSATMERRRLLVRDAHGHVIGEIERYVGHRREPLHQRGDWATNGAKWAAVHDYEGRPAVFAGPGFMPEGVSL